MKRLFPILLSTGLVLSYVSYQVLQKQSSISMQGISLTQNDLNAVEKKRISITELDTAGYFQANQFDVLKENNNTKFSTTKSFASQDFTILDLTISQQQNENNDIPQITEVKHIDFDSDFLDWDLGKNLWQIGSPVYGPDNLCGDSAVCLGLNLADAYTDFENAEAVSPSISIPPLADGEKIILSLRNWRDIHITDRVNVSIMYEFNENVWVKDKPLAVWSGKSKDWSNFEKDISEYSGFNIKLLFELQQDPEKPGSGPGWLIDDIVIQKIS